MFLVSMVRSVPVARPRELSSIRHPLGRHLKALVVEGDFEFDLTVAYFSAINKLAEGTLRRERDLVAIDLPVLNGSFVLCTGDRARQFSAIHLEVECVHPLRPVGCAEFRLPFAADVR